MELPASCSDGLRRIIIIGEYQSIQEGPRDQAYIAESNGVDKMRKMEKLLSKETRININMKLGPAGTKARRTIHRGSRLITEKFYQMHQKLSRSSSATFPYSVWALVLRTLNPTPPAIPLSSPIDSIISTTLYGRWSSWPQLLL